MDTLTFLSARSEKCRFCVSLSQLQSQSSLTFRPLCCRKKSQGRKARKTKKAVTAATTAIAARLTSRRKVVVYAGGSKKRRAHQLQPRGGKEAEASLSQQRDRRRQIFRG